jgi:DnaJ-class molecular chaperone
MDLYEQLGVERTASPEEIKKAYRIQARKHHPDTNPDDPAAEERFKDIANAYEVLKDSAKRKLYDEFGDLALTKGFNPDQARSATERTRSEGSNGWSNFDPSRFQGGSRGAREASFEDVISSMFRGRAHAGSSHTGDPFGSAGPSNPFGPFGAQSRTEPDKESVIDITFLESVLGAKVAVSPRGHRTNKHADTTLDVTIPEGIKDGERIRLKNAGVLGKDLILTVKVAPSEKYKRDGYDLRQEITVSLYQAYAGVPVDVDTPWGAVSLKLRAATQPGQVMRIAKRGVRVKGVPQGDMLVSLKVRIPEPGDKELLKSLKRLQDD